MMGFNKGVIVLFSVLISIEYALACPYDYLTGEWKMHIGTGGEDNYVDCGTMGLTREVRTMKLLYPDLVVDEYGNRGYWTMVTSAGLEIRISGRSYVAILMYSNNHEDNTTTYCSDTMPGWTHEEDSRDWACFQGHKAVPNTESPPDDLEDDVSEVDLEQMYEQDHGFIEEINAAQDMWTAAVYPEYESMTLHDMKMRGGWIPADPGKIDVMKASRELKDRAAKLPEDFDWRNVDSVDYVTPVRDQGSCGSCYAFATAGMCEARLRVHTKNAINVVLSPQDVVDCSPYSYGCSGAYTYLVVGQFTEGFGMVEESCNPYRANMTGICETDTTCRRHYFSGHHYVGGYYGACNEEAMRISLVENGPFVVSFLVTGEFFHYQSGVFKETGITRKFDPYLRTNHAVLLVGYGIEKTNGTKYWTVKNSWGEDWGEDGYFRIIRGTNELNIESKGAETFPML